MHKGSLTKFLAVREKGCEREVFSGRKEGSRSCSVEMPHLSTGKVQAGTADSAAAEISHSQEGGWGRAKTAKGQTASRETCSVKK